MKKSEAIDELIKAGATREKREDRHGDTRSGWWMDTVFLGTDPIVALQALRG